MDVEPKRTFDCYLGPVIVPSRTQPAWNWMAKDLQNMHTV